MNDVKTLVRRQYQSFDEGQAVITLDEIAVRRDDVPVVRSVALPPRRRGVYVALGVALVILLAGLIPYLFRGDDVPPADTVVPTTLAEPTPSSTVPETRMDDEGSGAPGSMVFRPNFHFALPDGWVKGSSLWFGVIAPSDFMESGSEPAVAITFSRPKLGTVQGVVERLLSRSGLRASEPQPVEVGGAIGQTLHATGVSNETLWEFEVEDSPTFGNFDVIIAKVDSIGQSTAGHDYDFYVVDVDGRTVTITADYLDTEQYDKYRPIVEQVIGSIRNWNCPTCP